MSNTWKLVNEDGEGEFGQSPMDLQLTPVGNFITLEGRQVLDQRVKKSVVTRKGVNRLSRDFGSTVADSLGKKATNRREGMSVSASLLEMVNVMVRSQTSVRRRIGSVIGPEEALTGVDQVQVVVGNDRFQVNAVLSTELGTNEVQVI